LLAPTRAIDGADTSIDLVNDFNEAV